MKYALVSIISFLAGAVTIWGFYFIVLGAMRDMRAEYVPKAWSTEGKEWVDAARWLKHGGRKLYMDGAVTSAADGLSEDEVRRIFGPPDLVLAGPAELARYPALGRKDAAGAYIYKIGTFASSFTTWETVPEAFAIIFDSKGFVIFRMGFGMKGDEPLVDIEADTRSNQRVAKR